MAIELPDGRCESNEVLEALVLVQCEWDKWPYSAR